MPTASPRAGFLPLPMLVLLALLATTPFWLDLFGAVVAAALLGAVVGACIAHKRGIYFALLTIAFGQVVWFVAVKWHSVTGGEDGLQNIARPVLPLGFAEVDLRSNEALFYFCLALFALALSSRRIPT